MSPNPSTICAEDIEVGFTVHAEDFDSGDSGVDCVSVGGLMASLHPAQGLTDGPRDGLPGGNASDPVAEDIGVDTEEIVCDTQVKAPEKPAVSVSPDPLAKISSLEADCVRYEAVYRQSQADCKAARSDLESAVARLRSYIRGLHVEMPMFDVSPAGENPEMAAEDGGAASVPDAAEPGADPGVDSGSGDLPEDSWAKAKPPAYACDDEKWKAARLADIVSAKEAKSLAAAGLTTVGGLASWTNDGGILTDIKGIGEKSAEKIEDALQDFWSQYNPNGK